MHPTMIEAYRAGVANGAAYASGLFSGDVRTTAEWARRYARGLRRNAGDRAYFLGLARGLRSHVWTGRYGIPD